MLFFHLHYIGLRNCQLDLLRLMSVRLFRLDVAKVEFLPLRELTLHTYNLAFFLLILFRNHGELAATCNDFTLYQA